MTNFRQSLIFGFLVWLFPFAVSFLIFPLRESNRPLFESIMPVAVALVVVVLAQIYFKRITKRLLLEGIIVGLVWMVISIVIDLFLFLPPGSPMYMPIDEYFFDIGVTYFMIPIIASGIAQTYGISIRQAKQKLSE